MKGRAATTPATTTLCSVDAKLWTAVSDIPSSANPGDGGVIVVYPLAPWLDHPLGCGGGGGGGLGGYGGGGGQGVWTQGCTPTPPPCAVGRANPPPPLGAFRRRWVQGAPPRANFFRDTLIMGVLCMGCGPNLSSGSPLGGEVCGWGMILGDSQRLGDQPVGG